MDVVASDATLGPGASALAWPTFAFACVASAAVLTRQMTGTSYRSLYEKALHAYRSKKLRLFVDHIATQSRLSAPDPCAPLAFTLYVLSWVSYSLVLILAIRILAWASIASVISASQLVFHTVLSTRVESPQATDAASPKMVQGGAVIAKRLVTMVRVIGGDGPRTIVDTVAEIVTHCTDSIDGIVATLRGTGVVLYMAWLASKLGRSAVQNDLQFRRFIDLRPVEPMVCRSSRTSPA